MTPPASSAPESRESIESRAAEGLVLRRVLFWTLVVLAVGLNAYLFAITYDQPVWWDEAEYLIKGKNMVLGTPETGWFSGRPILLPLTVAGVYGVGLGETAVRVLLSLSAIGGILLTWRVGRRIAGDVAGFVAGACSRVSTSCRSTAPAS